MAQRRVSIVLDAAVQGFQRGMQQAQRQTQSFGQSLQQNAATLTRLGVGMTATAGIMAAGMRSVARETAEFESTLMRMRTQIGLTEQEARDMGQAALELGHTGRGPQELGDALWFAGSAGLRGVEATEAVEASAKAAAIGLGETATVVDLVTSAMNAYGSETLDAEQATDVLVGTVRQGKAEAPALAAALGQILPIASEMGVQFNDVGAAVAAMTRTGTDAGTAAMQLRQILASLLNPAQGVEQAMNDLGISSEQVRATIRDDGLWQAMMDLRDAAGDNEQALGQLFPNIRALAGFLDLTGANAEQNAAIFAEMADTTGLLSDGFEQWGDSTEAAQQRFSAALEAAKITAGEDFQPAMQSLLDTGTSLLERFIELDPAVRRFGSQAAMAGTAILGVSGSVLTTAGSTALLVASLRNMGVGLSSVTRLLNPYTVAITAATAVTVGLVNAWQDGQRQAGMLADEIRATADTTEDATRQMQQAMSDHVDEMTSTERAFERVKNAALGPVGAYRNLRDSIGDLSVWVGLRREMGSTEESFDLLQDRWDEPFTNPFRDPTEGAQALDSELRELMVAAGASEAEIDELAGAMGGFADETQTATEAVNDFSDAQRALTDPVFAARQALQELEAAQTAAAEAADEHGRQSDEYRDAAFRVIEAALGAEHALLELTGAQIEAGLSGESLRQVTDRLMTNFGLTRDQADLLVDEFIRLKGRADDLEGDYPIRVTAETSDARREVGGLLGALDAINRTWRARIEVSGARIPPGVEIRHGGGRVGMDPAPTTTLTDPMAPNERLVLAEVGERVVTEHQWHAMTSPTVQVMHAGGVVGGGGTSIGRQMQIGEGAIQLVVRDEREGMAEAAHALRRIELEHS